MTIDWNFFISLGWPIVLLFIGALINHLLEKRERLIAYLGHISSFKLNPAEGQNEPAWIYTHSVIVRNNGSKTAENIRLGHAYLPNVTINPDIQYKINDLPSGGKEILIPKLVPKKEITISYLYYPPTTWDKINTHLESDNGPIKVVRVLLQIQPPKWLIRMIFFLMLVGLIGVIYVVAELFIKFSTYQVPAM